MDEVNVVIQSVLPVQQSLPPQKEKGLEVQSKSEDSSFDHAMRMENKSGRKRRKQSEKMHQKIEKKTFFLKPETKEEPSVKKEEKKRQNSYC